MECGACENSGWSKEASRDGLNLPDEEFDYERFVAEEFGGGARESHRRKLWAFVAIVVLVAFTTAAFGGCWLR